MVLRPRIPSPDWRYAKCGGTIVHRDDPDPWFDDEPAALEFCNTPACGIREQCLVFALTNNCAAGVYGGMSEVDRKALRKKWPLRKGYKVNGKTTWDPRPEWHWMEPGKALEGLDAEAVRAELEQEMAYGEAA
jgi:hypothetical protein